MNKKMIKIESERNYPSKEEENKIIEEIKEGQKIIYFPNLNKEYEDLEIDDNDDDLSEKDKVTEDILNNKLSIFIPDNNEEEEINSNTQKIQKDIIENLLIKLFDYHYNDIIGIKSKTPINKIIEVESQIEFYYTKLNNNFIYFSKYILLILEQKIEELIDNTKNKLNKNKIIVKDILNIKKSLHLVGNDINKIFKLVFEKTKEFDIPSILEILFIREILNDSEIDINDKEYEEITDISRLEEKDNFEKYTEECRLYFEKIENGEREEEDIEVEEEKQNYTCLKDKNEKIKKSNKGNKNIKIKININVDQDILNNNKEILKEKSYQIKNLKIENKEENDSKNTKKIDNLIERNDDSLTVEDLLKYINGSDNQKKKKKKRRKKKKEKINEDKIYINNEEIEQKDEEYENFKLYIIEFSECVDKSKKIKPNICETFLEELKLHFI